MAGAVVAGGGLFTSVVEGLDTDSLGAESSFDCGMAQPVKKSVVPNVATAMARRETKKTVFMGRLCFAFAKRSIFAVC